MTRLNDIRLYRVGRSDHGGLVAMPSQSVMDWRSRNAIRPNGNIARDMIGAHGDVASGSAAGKYNGRH